MRASATSSRGGSAAADRGDRVAARRAAARTGSCCSTGRTARSARAIRSTRRPARRRRRPRRRRWSSCSSTSRSSSRRSATHPADDLVTALAHAEVDGSRLPPLDLLAYCLIIVVAGNETTRNATSGGMLALVEHPSEIAKLQRNPALLASARRGDPALDESDHPLRAHRHARTSSCAARRSARASSSRSSTRRRIATRKCSTTPFTFRVDRDPNRHLAFGIGEHFCARRARRAARAARWRSSYLAAAARRARARRPRRSACARRWSAA